jgi:outer membrane cobalamin receptor
MVSLLAYELILSGAQVTFGQTDDATGTYTLGEIVVSAEKPAVESVGTTREVTAEDIQNRDARTIDEALQLLPGVNIRTGGEGVPRVDYRGFKPRHTLILLDGIPLNSTVDGQYDPTLIPVENIAKIKMMGGNSSLLYGEGDLGGVINIVTKKGSRKGIHGTLSGEGGEEETSLVRGTVSGSSDKMNFFLSSSAYNTNGFRLADDFTPTDQENGGLRENSFRRRQNYFAQGGYSPRDDLDIGMVFQYYRSEFGKPPSTINGTDDFASKSKYERVDDLEGISGHVAITYDVPGPLELRSWVYVNQLRENKKGYDDNHYRTMDDPLIKGTYHERDDSRITGANMQVKYDLESWGFFTLGFNGRRESWDSEGKIRDVEIPKTKPKKYAFRYFDDDKDLDVSSAVLEYNVTLFDHAGLVLGYRHNWLEKDGGGNDHDWNFLAGLYYDLTKDTRIKGSAARKTRFPSISQLYDEQSGNPGLSTETSYNYEAGIEQNLPWQTKVGLTGFYTDVKNYIEKVAISSSVDRYQNNDKYLFEGIEIMGENRFFKNLMVRLGYTFLHTRDRSTGSEKDELQYRPIHKFTAEGNYLFDFGLSANVNLTRVADQYFYSKNTPLQKKKLGNFTILNMKVDQALFNRRLHLYAGVDNVCDEKYEESYAFPQAGRFVYGGMEIPF